MVTVRVVVDVSVGTPTVFVRVVVIVGTTTVLVPVAAIVEIGVVVAVPVTSVVLLATALLVGTTTVEVEVPATLVWVAVPTIAVPVLVAVEAWRVAVGKGEAGVRVGIGVPTVKVGSAVTVACGVTVAPAWVSAAKASMRPQPKWLLGMSSGVVPPQSCRGSATVTLGLALCCISTFVSVMLRTKSGRADQMSATTPTVCGPAIEVPSRLPYAVSLALREERTFTPGAEMFGLSRSEPSLTTGPLLLNSARVLVISIAPVSNEASNIWGSHAIVEQAGPSLPADTSMNMPAAWLFSTAGFSMSPAHPSTQAQLLFST